MFDLLLSNHAQTKKMMEQHQKLLTGFLKHAEGMNAAKTDHCCCLDILANQTRRKKTENIKAAALTVACLCWII